VTTRPLTADALRRFLPGHRIVWAVHAFGSVASTNDVAVRLARSDAPEGTLVVSGVQTAGRGRRGSRWESPEGGLWMSFVLRPAFETKRRPGVSLVAASALARTLHAATGLAVRLKWPNDVFVEGRKVAGAMVRTAGDALVVGVGINVNVPADDLPRGPRYEATSLLRETGRTWDRARLLGRFLDGFERRYEDYAGRNASRVMDEWRGLSLVLGELVSIAGGGFSYEGSVVGIEEDAALVVRLPDGRQQRVPPLGDVTCAVLRTEPRRP
jgi:BirA family biotin operon repressor/biotin-[acetyl-CoA-carboxylase] ligase